MRIPKLTRIHPLSINLEPIGEVQSILSSGKSDPAIAKGLAVENARENLMKLQQLAKDYGTLDPDFFGKLGKQFHDFSHELGAYVLTREMIEYGKQVGAPPEVMRLLSEDEKIGERNLIEFLKREKWIDEKKPKLEKTREKLSEADWLKPRKEKKFLLENYVKKIEEIDRTDWDMDKFNKGGMHELRRKLREIALAFQGQRGAVVLEDRPCPIAAFAGLVNTAVAESKYAKLPGSPDYPDPIRVTQCLYLGLAQFVDDIGEVKDVGEREEIMAKKFEQLGFSEGEARQKAEELASKLPGYGDVVSNAKKLYDRLRRGGWAGPPRRAQGSAQVTVT